MATKKQRKRELKAKRHEYEFVYVDAEGNELDEPPPELLEAERGKKDRQNGTKASVAKGADRKPAPRGRTRREPQPPSWNRAVKRAFLLGAVVFVFFAMTGGKSSNRYLAGAWLGGIYVVLFIPFTYWIDKVAYKRFQAREAGGAGRTTPRPAKKR